MKLGGNTMKLVFDNNEERNYNQDFSRKMQNKNQDSFTHFSFNSPEGLAKIAADSAIR